MVDTFLVSTRVRQSAEVSRTVTRPEERHESPCRLVDKGMLITRAG
jgi:hypothetical protein